MKYSKGLRLKSAEIKKTLIFCIYFFNMNISLTMDVLYMQISMRVAKKRSDERVC